MPESAPSPQDPPVDGKSSPELTGPAAVKTCPACKIEKPLTEYFRSKRLPQGASFYCKLCDTKRKKDGHIQTRPSRFVDGGCVCAKCKQTLPFSEFYRTATGGVTSRCRKCSSVTSLAYHKTHPKDHAKLAREYRKANPEIVDAAWKRFHEKRPELKFLQGARVRAKRKGLAFDLHDHASEIAERLAKMRCERWAAAAPVGRRLTALVGGFGRNNERSRDMKKQGDKVAASVTVYRVGDMTTRGRKAVCGWLRKLADDLQNEPEAFAKTFRARYLYPARV